MGRYTRTAKIQRPFMAITAIVLVFTAWSLPAASYNHLQYVSNSPLCRPTTEADGMLDGNGVLQHEAAGWYESGYTETREAVPSIAPRSSLYQHEDLSTYEQLMLELVNRARANPGAEASRFGIDLNEGLDPGEISDAPKQPLAYHPFLGIAAADHSLWMLLTNTFSHTGAAGSRPSERAADAGYPLTGTWGIGENISWRGTTGSFSPTEYVYSMHEGLFLSSGHRRNILNDRFNEIGIGLQSGQFTTNDNSYNALMGTQKFGHSGGTPGPLILGVVFEDESGDGFYAPGEGVEGVLIEVTDSEYYDVTSASGGYAVPVPSDGEYRIDFIIDGAIFHTDYVTVSNGENVKVDLIVGMQEPTGTLQILIEPWEAIQAGAQWRLLGTTTWRDSGYVETALSEGNYWIEFRELADWRAPSTLEVVMEPGSDVSLVVTYTEDMDAPETGSLQVFIEPFGARAAGAQWRIQGTTTWRSSGFVEADLQTGLYTVEFRAVNEWQGPDTISVEVVPGETVTQTGTYSPLSAPDPTPDPEPGMGCNGAKMVDWLEASLADQEGLHESALLAARTGDDRHGAVVQSRQRTTTNASAGCLLTMLLMAGIIGFAGMYRRGMFKS